MSKNKLLDQINESQEAYIRMIIYTIKVSDYQKLCLGFSLVFLLCIFNEVDIIIGRATELVEESQIGPKEVNQTRSCIAESNLYLEVLGEMILSLYSRIELDSVLTCSLARAFKFINGPFIVRILIFDL
ncbi:hypothetical protein K501DRAFT_271560 [Backusella circina FSU 941]|nr:hypothetical protein K501DRAFT_271560 [Backusella circina FSU 941]